MIHEHVLLAFFSKKSFIFFSISFFHFPPKKGTSTPIVIWHGLGQSCCDPDGIGRVKSVIANTTKSYIVAIKIGNSVLDDTINGFFTPVNQQVQLGYNELSLITNLI